MNLNLFEQKADFFHALKTLFASLNVPVNYIDEKSIPPKEILSKTYKENREAYLLMDDVFVLGMVDNAAFEGEKSGTVADIKKDEKDYEGILLFGVTLKNRDNGLLPTRSQLSEITRAFNREFYYTPVVVVFKYEQFISIANTERIAYKQQWREGEKPGKVSILRDIHVIKPHTGHLKILQELTIPRTGRAAVNTFAGLYSYWQSVFNVSILNKKFYKELSDWYFWALQEVAFPATTYVADKTSLFKEEERVKEHNAKNLIRLLTRLLFVWFVKEKNLIPEELFDETYIRENLINGFEPRKKKDFDHHTQGSKYYRAILQNLFFATLNQTVGKREFRKEGQQMNVTNLMRYESYFKNPKAFIELVEASVPFMNGGLFECLDSPDTLLKGKRGGDVIIYEDGFSDRKDNTLCVPDYIFFGIDEHADLSVELGDKKHKEVSVNGLIHILNSYKFTVTENTPIEQDVALDPELLGKVFENLLASYNPETKTTARKQTGSFYTPREIVNYMVDESIKAYFQQKFDSESTEKSNNSINSINSKKSVEQAFLPVNFSDNEPENSSQENMGQKNSGQTGMSDLPDVPVHEQNNGINKTRRHLPHWTMQGVYYFITFRKKDAPLFTQNERKIIHEHILEGNKKFYHLICSIVMPDHVHVILKPNEHYELCGIMKGIKGVSANKLNKINSAAGSVWQDESFDRIIRDEKELNEKLQYMYNNPMKKGVTERTEEYVGWYISKDQNEMIQMDIESRLNNLISYSDAPNPFDEAETKKLIDAIDNCKILDPACGSGAFPMGILHKLVHILHKLDPNNHLWKERQIAKARAIDDSEIRDNIIADIETAFANNELDYGRKLYLIENCIYGVDIQPIATQISKLRFFISLIVDQNNGRTGIPARHPAHHPVRVPDNFGIRPLPNLETKFVAANTLIGIEKPKTQISMFENTKVRALEEKLKDVRHRLFSARTPATKRKLREEDQRLRDEMGALLEDAGWTNETARQLAGWDPYNQNVSSAFFDAEWMFGITDGFDVVIGNPPYVQLQKEGGNLAEMYKNCGYKTFERTGDIYALFYENGINILNESGCLCLITSNKWMRAGYGKSLRQFFSQQYPKLLIDLGPGVFESATVDVNILIIQKRGNRNSSSTLYGATLDAKAKDTDISFYVNRNKTALPKMSKDAWFIGNQAEQNLKEKIERIGKPLNEWDVNIYRGVLTGLNEAFIIDTSMKERLCAEDSKSAEILKPILRGRDIKRYAYEWAGLWLIATLPALKIDIEEYPAVKKYLLSCGRERLEQAGKKLPDGTTSRKKTGNKWFETQDQINYYHEFEKEKVVWKALGLKPAFCYVKEHIYTNDKANLLTSDTISLKFLFGFFNSKLFEWQFRNIGVNMGEGYEYKIQFMNLIPIPPITLANLMIVEQIESLVKKILSAKQPDPKADTSQAEWEIDRLVYELFELTAEEIAIVESTIPTNL